MSKSRDIFERICGYCPLRDRCYNTGLIEANSCGLLKHMGSTPIALKIVVEFKAMEKFKYEESERQKRDIGWDELLDFWHDKQHLDAAFGYVYSEDAPIVVTPETKINFIDIFREMLGKRVAVAYDLVAA